MSKRKKDRSIWAGDNYWQSANYNSRQYIGYLDMLLSLAMNRFRWENLPETCDVRYFERQLHMSGKATIAHDTNSPDLWLSLKAIAMGQFNIYGVPTRWNAVGWGGEQFEATPETGEICYYNQSRTNPWNMLELFARRMAHYSRTEDINLSHQHKPWLLIAPQEQRQELINIYKQVAGNEPAILGNKQTWELVDNIKAIDTQVPLVVDELNQGFFNTFHNALVFLGIPSLAFEKGERMIEDEARANSAPTNILLMDCLSARREFAKTFNARFGTSIEVYYNEDIESYNYNYVNNIEAMAQDGILGGESIE